MLDRGLCNTLSPCRFHSPSRRRTSRRSYRSPLRGAGAIWRSTRSWRGLTPANRRWTYGEKHPNSRDYPNHELVAVVPQDHEWERWYYAAPRADQHNYNWEYSEQGEWETLGQTFFVKRCEFSLLTSDYPAPDAELFDSTGYVVTALEEQDVRDETLQSLYVIVRVRREKILDNPKVSTVLDPQTNTLRTVTIEKVPVGTAAEVVGEDGQYAEVQAINTRWALKTTQFMAGLAGNGDGAFQQWEDVINYSWPDVLDYIGFFTFPSSSGSVKSIGSRPIWKRQRYDGPCRARITETWTKTRRLLRSSNPCCRRKFSIAPHFFRSTCPRVCTKLSISGPLPELSTPRLGFTFTWRHMRPRTCSIGRKFTLPASPSVRLWAAT